MFLKASRLKLRFDTVYGVLSTESLWDLKLSQLNVIAKSLNKIIKAEAEEDFLDEKSEEDTITKLKFDIVLEIINIKKEEEKAKTNAADIKSHNQKILKLIAEKQDEELSKKSVEELTKLLK